MLAGSHGPGAEEAVNAEDEYREKANAIVAEHAQMHGGQHVAGTGIVAACHCTQDDMRYGPHGLMFLFLGRDGLPSACPVVVDAEDAELDALVEGVRARVDEVKAARARDRQEGLANPVVVDHCPGCGRRIFGAAQDRGACFECFPEVVS